jgi:hypothetical protein
MADSVMLFDAAQTHAADTEFFVRRGMTKGYQILSLLAPPVYVAFAISRHGRSHLNVNRVLRATWLGGSVGEYSSVSISSKYISSRLVVQGVVGGGAFEYLRSQWTNHEQLRNRRVVATYSVSILYHERGNSELMTDLPDLIVTSRRSRYNRGSAVCCYDARNVLEAC